jgi:hypothetical protein
MSNKILVAVAVAILFASTGLASAQTRTHHRAPYAYGYDHSYYDRTYLDGAAQFAPSLAVRPDPFAGTYWEGVVPY